jgi:XRE family transcriptional regulator, regulator of sulfur utilization
MLIKSETPDVQVSEMTRKLGRTIRRLRSACRYSIGELSELSGVAKSIISLIETNDTNPTLATLRKLARALNVTMDDILDFGVETALLEKVGVSENRSPDLSWRKTARAVRWRHIVAEPGEVLCEEPHFIGSVENLTVLRGVLMVAVGKEHYTVNAGETARYRADLSRRIANSGAAEASAIMVELLFPIANATVSHRRSRETTPQEA